MLVATDMYMVYMYMMYIEHPGLKDKRKMEYTAAARICQQLRYRGVIYIYLHGLTVCQRGMYPYDDLLCTARGQVRGLNDGQGYVASIS